MERLVERIEKRIKDLEREKFGKSLSEERCKAIDKEIIELNELARAIGHE